MGSAATAVEVETSPAVHARTPGLGILGTHPMREKIVKAILSRKETTREIAAWCEPPVTHVTISRLAKQVNAELAEATAIHKAKQMQSVADIIAANEKTPEQVTALAVSGNRHLARIERLLSPLERQVALADSVNDRQGLSAVAKTALSAIRTQAELDGSLLQSSAPTVQANNFFVFPSIVVNHSGNPVNPPVTLDVTPETIERD